MKRKIIGILVCMLLIAVSVSSVAGTIDENESLNMKDDDYNNLIKQVIEHGVISNNDWLEQDKLLASDGADFDYFGFSVSIDGDYAIIGAYADDDNGDKSGSAFIFKRESTSWNEQAKLVPSDGAADDCFGISVSIDGDYAIIGADGDDNFKGSAYVFKRDGTNWTQEDKLIASDGATGDCFGFSVSIDGDYAIIGAKYDDDNGSNSGSAYIFKRESTSWTEQAKLLASDRAVHDWFGWSVSIDGDYAIIGARYDDDNGIGSGSAYIFIRSGTSWSQQAKLLASDGAEWDQFGYSVSIDGDYAIIGAKYDDDNGKDSGSAYIFKRDGTSWSQQAKLLASDGALGDAFGFSVSIDGDYAIIGARWNCDNGEDSGSAYIFKKLDPNAPNAPTINGKTNGKKGTEYEYTFNAVDPNGDNVKYHIDWDDGDSDTTAFSSSGTNVKVKHTWSNQGTYIIKATAEDTNGLVGPEGTLSITMPRNRAVNTPFLQFLYNFLQQYPILYQLLQRFLQP